MKESLSFPYWERGRKILTSQLPPPALGVNRTVNNLNTISMRAGKVNWKLPRHRYNRQSVFSFLLFHLLFMVLFTWDYVILFSFCESLFLCWLIFKFCISLIYYHSEIWVLFVIKFLNIGLNRYLNQSHESLHISICYVLISFCHYIPHRPAPVLHNSLR